MLTGKIYQLCVEEETQAHNTASFHSCDGADWSQLSTINEQASMSRRESCDLGLSEIS